MKSSFHLRRLVVFTWLAWVVSGCSAVLSPPPTPDMFATAAAQATQIVLQAQSTVMVKQAQTQAAALLAAPAPSSTPSQGSTALSDPPSQPSATQPASSPSPGAGSSTPQAPSTEVTLVRVGYAAEGAMLIIQFTAPYELARSWSQGNVYLVDEASGALYNEIPVMPIIGPLIARPKFAGQLGYVMLTNTPGLAPGSLVTVVLGAFKQEHILFQP